MSRSLMNRRQVLARTAAAAGGLALAGPASGLLGTTAAAAAMPRVYTRAEWGARPPDFAARIINKPDHLVVHHTASDNVTDFSLNQAFRLSRWIQDLHQLTNGWGDTGNQLTISRGGFIMEGRNRSLEAIGQGQNVLGAQTANNNSHTLGIENEGIYVSARPTQWLWDSLVETLAWLCDVYDLDPHQAIVGHRDYVATQCPGDVFYAMLPDLRDDVAGRLLGSRRTGRAEPDGRTAPKASPAGSARPGPAARRLDHGPALGPGETLR
ncbi:MAG TPA: peptidoglycan recognition family protein [Streptosporangiaceae bacterium]|nr:peptidoglycan recognition family protein [Streptosporangiaceae bacterium]